MPLFKSFETKSQATASTTSLPKAQDSTPDLPDSVVAAKKPREIISPMILMADGFPSYGLGSKIGGNTRL